MGLSNSAEWKDLFSSNTSASLVSLLDTQVLESCCHFFKWQKASLKWEFSFYWFNFICRLSPANISTVQRAGTPQGHRSNQAMQPKHRAEVSLRAVPSCSRAMLCILEYHKVQNRCALLIVRRALAWRFTARTFVRLTCSVPVAFFLNIHNWNALSQIWSASCSIWPFTLNASSHFCISKWDGNASDTSQRLQNALQCF